MKSKTFKQKLISALIETRIAILQEASQLSREARDTVFLGTWALKDLLAHLAATKDIKAWKIT